MAASQTLTTKHPHCSRLQVVYAAHLKYPIYMIHRHIPSYQWALCGSLSLLLRLLGPSRLSSHSSCAFRGLLICAASRHVDASRRAPRSTFPPSAFSRSEGHRLTARPGTFGRLGSTVRSTKRSVVPPRCAVASRTRINPVASYTLGSPARNRRDFVCTEPRGNNRQRRCASKCLM